MAFIVTQYPPPEDTVDFLRLLYDHVSDIVICMNPLSEIQSVGRNPYIKKFVKFAEGELYTSLTFLYTFFSLKHGFLKKVLPRLYPLSQFSTKVKVKLMLK